MSSARATSTLSPGMQQVGRIERSHIADVVSKFAAALMMRGAEDDVAMPTASASVGGKLL